MAANTKDRNFVSLYIDQKSQPFEKAESREIGRNCCMTHSLTLSFTDLVSNPYVGFRHRKRKSIIDSRDFVY